MNAQSRKGTLHVLKGAALAAALAGLAVCTATGPAAAATPQVYAALGDSMASGPLIPDITGPLACGRSTHNYAHDLTQSMGIPVLNDATCSGASSTDMTQPQSLSILGVSAGQAAPQFSVLTSDTSLVTLTIGGNDVGLVGIAEKCVRLDPTATPCEQSYVQNGVDQVAQRIDAFGPKLAAVLDGIHQLSPNAKVLVTGYGDYVKPGGCWPLVPLLSTDADWLQGSVNRLNQVISDEAAAHGATYVDVYTPSNGHDACQSTADKWVEGFVPTSSAAPLHPNEQGEAAYAQIIQSTLSSGA